MIFNSRPLCVSVICALSFSIHSASASEWALDADGNWNVAGNWLGPIPDGAGATAKFGPAISQNRSVSVDDPVDGTVLVESILFDSHFGYSLSLPSGKKLSLLGGPTGLIEVPGEFGNARHAIGKVSGTSLPNLALPSNLVIANYSAGQLNLETRISGSNGTLTKIGPGALRLELNNQSYSGASQVVVKEGSFTGLFGFSETLILDGGRYVDEDTGASNPIAIQIGPSGGTIDIRDDDGTNVTHGLFGVANANTFTGSGRLRKEGMGELRFTAAQPGFTGPVEIRGGEIVASNSSNPLSNAQSFSIVGTNGITTGQLRLSSANYSTVPISVRSGGVLVAPSGLGVGLSSMTRGVNLSLAAGAVVAQTLPGGNASIQGLQPTQDLFFGIGADQSISALTIGTGTPWMGLSGIGGSASTLNSSAAGTITANGDFTIQHYDRILQLNNTGIVSNSERRVINIAAPTAGSLGQGTADHVLLAGTNTSGEGITITGTPNLSGVSKFVVSNGATFNISSAGVLGTASTQAPVLEVQSGGRFTKAAVSNPIVPDTLGLGAAAATIVIKGPSQVTITKPNDPATATGGKFVVESQMPASLNVGSSASNLGADSLTFSVPGAALSFSGTISGSTTFNTEATINASSSATLNGGLIGSGVFNKGSSGRLIIDASKSNFAGPGSQLRIDAGTVELTNGGFDAGPNGPSVFIGQSPLLLSAGVFSFSNNVDEGTKLTSGSVGILAIHGANSSLSGVNNSLAYIGADGTQDLTTGSLAPGSAGVYRLGGGLNTPVLNVTGVNVLTGANDLVVGMPAAALGAVITNGSGTVVLRNSNSYTGSTKVNTKSTLVIEGIHALGDGPAVAGRVDLDGIMSIRAGGTLGTSGPITVNYGATLQVDDTGVVNSDRIPDATPIQLRSGTITYFANNAATTLSTETIGQSGSGVALLDGASIIGAPSTKIPLTSTATLTIGEITRQVGTTLMLDRISGQSTKIGNGDAFMANGVIPWLGSDNGGIYSNTPTMIAGYSGPFQDQIDSATETENVRVINTTGSMTANRTINSLQLSGNVDTGGNILNVGTATIDSVRSGAIYFLFGIIGSGANPGKLTAGQSAFAPNSAVPGELIVHAVANSATIAASIVDNAGPDGVFGNADDLPVCLTVTSDGTLNLTGQNSYSGGTFINEGTVIATSPLPGNVRLNIGELRLSAPATDMYLVGGDITVSNSANAASQRVFIQTPTVASTGSGERSAYNLHGLTVTPGSVAGIRGDVAVMEVADFRGAQIFVNTNSSLVGSSSLRIRGTYLDDAQTYIRSRLNSAEVESYFNGIRFQSGKTVDVHATIASAPRFSAEMNTVVNFFGTLSNGNTAGVPSDRIIAAATGGTVRLMPGATINNVSGWSGNSYSSVALHLHGDSSGTIEFMPGFKLMQAAGTNHFADIGANDVMFESPVTLITNDSDNLPNFSQAVMNNLPPNIYLGEINMRADGARWIVQSNAQFYNQKIDFAADTRIVTSVPLTFTSDSAIGMGDQDNISLSDHIVDLRQGTRSGSMEKLGSADLAILGRLYVVNYSRIIIGEGRLLFGNKSYEGYGRMDVDVRGGATLAGGSVDGSAGLIPGTLRVQSGGTVDPGNSSNGILSVIGDQPDVVFEAGSNYRPDLAGTVPGELHDQLKLLGKLILGDSNGLPILAPQLDYVPTIGDLMFVIRDDSNAASIGRFRTPAGTTLNQKDYLNVGSFGDDRIYQLQISYSGDADTGQFALPTGNDVALMVVAVFTPIPGDFNLDGSVDAADYVAWRKNDGTQIGYNKVRAHFGESINYGSSLSESAVPEPPGMALLIVALVTMIAHCRCQRVL